jgi:hypothetical protein
VPFSRCSSDALHDFRRLELGASSRAAAFNRFGGERDGILRGTARQRTLRSRLGEAQLPEPLMPSSGRCCVSAAVTETLEHFFGTDEVCFSIDSNVAGLLSPVRSYERFSDALREVIDARTYGGMHYPELVEGRGPAWKAGSSLRLRHNFRKVGRDRDHVHEHDEH